MTTTLIFPLLTQQPARTLWLPTSSPRVSTRMRTTTPRERRPRSRLQRLNAAHPRFLARKASWRTEFDFISSHHGRGAEHECLVAGAMTEGRTGENGNPQRTRALLEHLERGEAVGGGRASLKFPEHDGRSTVQIAAQQQRCHHTIDSVRWLRNILQSKYGSGRNP